MRIILGKILLGLGLIGLIFTIYGSRPAIWVLLFVILFLLGLGLIYYKAKKDLKELYEAINLEITKLKTSGQKIKLDFENCEFKERSYTTDIIDENFSRFGHINFDYGKVIAKEFVAQSLLIYTHKEGENTELFKQDFECSADALKLNALRNAIDLYVDRSNRKKFFFELKDTRN
jgi:hypothetical protein